MLPEYREVFLEELDEQLSTMEKEILHLEREAGSEYAVQSLFRAAHTLKGSSAAMGFEEMNQLTHEMEHLLDQVRNRQLDVTGMLINLLFESFDMLKRLKAEIEAGNPISSDISPITMKLRSFQSGARRKQHLRNKEIPEMPPELKQKLEAAREQGLKAYQVRLFIADNCMMKKVRAVVIYRSFLEWADILLAEPHPESSPGEDQDSFDELLYVLTTEKTEEELRGLVDALVDVEEADIEVIDTLDWLMDAETEKVLAAAGETAAAAVRTPQPERMKAQTVRVSVERLDHLMNLVGELVIDRTRISQVERELSQRFGAEESVDNLALISDHLTRTIGELQDSVMKARMLPIEQLFDRFPRLVRDLSQRLNKPIELVLEGKETELDRTLIEDLADPMIHIIRNAIDHGIEGADVRSKAGKSPHGTIHIRAAHEDNRVVIAIRDDGAGINPGALKESAVRKGVISAEEAAALSDAEAVQLIFRSGLSTSSTVSDISGRGVGMDIVRNHIEQLNGIIDIDTQPGAGTEFKIRLPLTLAIITGLLVRLSGRVFVIPMSNIAEIIRVEPNQLQTVRGDSVIVLRNQVIPIVRIKEYLNLPDMEETGKRHQSVVVVGVAEKRAAFVVDELIGNQEIVLKSLGGFLGKVKLISGATILGDGNVALILEVSALVGKRKLV